MSHGIEEYYHILLNVLCMLASVSSDQINALTRSAAYTYMYMYM